MEARGRGGVALLPRLAARVLAQHTLELRRAHALLVLVARPAVLAQEHLLVAHVDCGRRRRRREVQLMMRYRRRRKVGGVEWVRKGKAVAKKGTGGKEEEEERRERRRRI